MRTLNYVIIEAEEAYVNTDGNFVVNTTIEDVSSINRVAKVISSPDNIIVSEGDYVVVHHNIMRMRNDVKGKTIQSNYHIKDNLYFVPLTEVFMYKTDNSDWLSLDPYCFIKPIESKEQETESLIKLSKKESSYKGYEKNRGILKYPNKSLINQGLKHGDSIVFSDYSEYEFNIGGELLYKMSTRDILMKE